MKTNNIYEQVYSFVRTCGAVKEPNAFCETIVEQLPSIIPFDQARILYFTVSGKIKGSQLYGVNKKSWDSFMEFYLEDSVYYRIGSQKTMKLTPEEKVSLRDHTKEQGKDKGLFFNAYIRAQNINSCLAMGLADADNCIRATIILDRIRLSCFSQTDLQFFRLLQPLLEHLYANLLLSAPDLQPAGTSATPAFQLTQRERQIVLLLCSGETPAAIADKYSISVSTVYRHIANIYKKTNVRNRQELFALQKNGL
ncbi:MAG: helix-turn-helix transcriptional regulator [Mogibacterium sp.]|nr:helix-turn-helix transcriptional regulator [Mogibacterium sp.]